jgi:hypothetical protein
MGQLRFHVDPDAIDKEALGKIIKNFTSIPGAQRYATIPGPNQDVFVTDNKKSGLWSQANKDAMARYDKFSPGQVNTPPPERRWSVHAGNRRLLGAVVEAAHACASPLRQHRT